MTLEDIKKMSDEEFVEFVDSLKNSKEETSAEEDLMENKKFVNFGSIMNGLIFGLVPAAFLDNFTDDNLILGTAFVAGAIAGIPTSKKLLRWVYTKFKNETKIIERQELIQLKIDLENLSKDELSFLIGIDKNEHIYELNDKIKRVFRECNPNKFIGGLEVTYEDDNKDLAYSKNINKNN